MNMPSKSEPVKDKDSPNRIEMSEMVRTVYRYQSEPMQSLSAIASNPNSDSVAPTNFLSSADWGDI